MSLAFSPVHWEDLYQDLYSPIFQYLHFNYRHGELQASRQITGFMRFAITLVDFHFIYKLAPVPV